MSKKKQARIILDGGTRTRKTRTCGT